MGKSRRLNPRRKVKYSKRKTKHHKRKTHKTRRYRARGGNPNEIHDLRNKFRGFIMYQNNNFDTRCKLKWNKLNDYPSMLDMLKELSIKINNNDNDKEIQQTKKEFAEKEKIHDFSDVKTGQAGGEDPLHHAGTLTFLSYNDEWKYISNFISSTGRNFVGRKITHGESILNNVELEYWLLYFNILYYEIQQNENKTERQCIPRGMSFKLITENVNDYISQPIAYNDYASLRAVIDQIKNELDNYTF